MADLTLETLRAELAPIVADLTSIKAKVDGLPLLNRAITVLQQDVRSVRAAVNDLAATNMTLGEIQALHHDVNRVQAENAELSTRIVTLERLVAELQKS